MSSVWLPIVLQAGAFFVGIAEIIIPSMGILTVISLTLLGYSWYYIIADLPPGAAWIFLIADILALPAAFYLAFKVIKASPLSHQQKLEHGSGLSKEPDKSLIGKTGVVEAPLKLTGKAFIEGALLEVSSEDGLIDKGETVDVVEISGSRIIVKKHTQP